MPDKQQSPTVTEPVDEIGVHMAHCYMGDNEGCKYGDEDCPARPAPDLGKDEELVERTKRIADDTIEGPVLVPTGDLRALLASLEALHAEREKLRERMRLIEFDATNKNSAPSARLQRIADYARAALSGKDSPDAP